MDSVVDHLDVPFPNGVEVERVATGATWAEGPLWIPGENVLRYSDVPADRILQFDPATGEHVVWKRGVEYVNGRAHHPDLGVVQCCQGRRALEKAPLVPFTEAEVLIDAFEGSRLNSPNDVATHPVDHTIWFTDPPYGILSENEGHAGEMEYGRSYVFRLDHHGDLTAVITELSRPNGIAFSPDARRLYVTNTAENPLDPAHDAPESLTDAAGRHHIWAFDLDADYALVRGSGRPFAAPRAGVPDGIAVDQEGRVFSSGADGITVVAADGTDVAFIPVPEVVSNLCFGGTDGHDLYITATTSLYRVRTTTRAAW
ncbi:MAG: SMP-30/gluconolactonase/LRE family protein [Dermabacter sp.]|nr:SMP-30/gluconolactonase/LRE family protein [Dermabacter sp.]